MSVKLVLSNWERIRSKLLETLDRFEAEDMDYRPAAGLWTVRELVLHIAHEEMIEIVYGITQNLDEFPAEYSPAGYPTKENLKELLTRIHSQSLEFIQTLEDSDLQRVVQAPWEGEFIMGEMIGHTMEHEAHHRGELSLILGILGREAPDI